MEIKKVVQSYVPCLSIVYFRVLCRTLFTVNLCSVLKNQDFVLENFFEKPATTLFTELPTSFRFIFLQTTPLKIAGCSKT